MLLSQVSSLRLPSGHSGLVLTLSNAASASLFSSHLLVVDASIWANSPLRVAVRCVICGFYFFFFPSQLCCPLRFQNFPQTRWWEGFLVFWNFSSFTTPSPGPVSLPNSFVFHFIFYILSHLLLKTMGCLSGCLVSSISVQKLFCGICSAFKWSFDEFMGGENGLPILFLCHFRIAIWNNNFRLKIERKMRHIYLNGFP